MNVLLKNQRDMPSSEGGSLMLPQARRVDLNRVSQMKHMSGVSMLVSCPYMPASKNVVARVLMMLVQVSGLVESGRVSWVALVADTVRFWISVWWVAGLERMETMVGGYWRGRKVSVMLPGNPRVVGSGRVVSKVGRLCADWVCCGHASDWCLRLLLVAGSG